MVEKSSGDFKRSENCLVLSVDYLNIKGLQFMGYGNFHQAEPPIPERYHPGCIEIHVMLNGSQRFWANGSMYTLLPGKAFTNFFEETHSSGMEPHGVSEFIYFGLNLEDPDGFLGLSAPFDRLLYEKAKSWNRRIVKVPEEGTELMRRAFSYFAKLADDKDDWDSRLQGHGLFLGFLNRFFHMEKPDGMENEIDEVLKYVEEHVTEPITVEELVCFSGFSNYQLRQRFKTAVGMGPKEYINQQKIEQAKIMLQQERRPSLTELSYRLGFPDSAYFSTLFRQLVSCSPSEYHKRWLRKISGNA